MVSYKNPLCHYWLGGVEYGFFYLKKNAKTYFQKLGSLNEKFLAQKSLFQMKVNYEKTVAKMSWICLFKLEKNRRKKITKQYFGNAVSLTPLNLTPEGHGHSGLCLHMRISLRNRNHIWKCFSVWIRGYILDSIQLRKTWV